MFARYLIIIFLIINIQSNSYASDDNFIHEGSLCETRWSTVLSALQTDIFRKLDAMDKKISNNIEDTNRKLDALEEKIPNILDEIKNKFSILEKINHDLEESSREKFRKIEKNILNLEEYIGEKLDSSVKHMYHKIDALEKILPDKVDINVLNYKLDALRNNQPDFGSTVRRVINDPLPNKTLDTNNDDNNENLDVKEKNMIKLEDTTTNCKFDALDKKITNLEENLSNKLTELKQMVPDLEENITNTLSAMNTRMQNHAEENNLGCNKVAVVHYDEYKPLFRMNNETLKHVSIRNDSDGLAYFEMHLAIKAKSGLIKLSPVPHPGSEDNYIEIDVGGNGNTWTHVSLNRKKVKDVNTLGILSSTQFTTFYVKINNGTLEFGREHTGTPILSYSDARLRTLKYFSFSTYMAEGAIFLYDCPPNVEMLATPCYSIN